MAGRGNASGAVHAEPDVALTADRRFAGVHAHAHAQLCVARPLVRGKRTLGVDGRADRVLRPAERGEEGVALGIDLPAVVRGERVADDALVLGEDRAVVVAQLLEQPRRALDVGEEEGDGAGGPLGRRAHRLVVHL